MFNKLLVSYMITIVVLTVLISGLSQYYFNRKVKEDFASATDASLRNVAGHVDAIEDEIDQLSLQLSLMPELNAMLRDPFDATILQYADLKDTLKRQTTMDSMLFSVYVYFKLNNKVLTTGEGLYDLEEFPDRSIVREAVRSQGEYKWREMRTLSDPVDAQTVDLITFERPIPITNKYPLGNLILNVRKSVYFNVLYKMSGVDGASDRIYVLDKNRRQVVSNNGSPSLAAALGDLFDQGGKEGTSGFQPARIGGRKYFVGYLKPTSGDWLFVKLIPYRDYTAKIYGKLSEIVRTAVVVLAIGFLLSFFFAFRMYQPWKRIVAAYFSAGQKPRRQDESMLVGEAIRRLIRENESIRSTLEQSEPIIRFRLVYEILTNTIVESALIESRLSQVGVSFSHPYFAVLVVMSDLREFEQQHDYNKIGFMLFSLIENAMQRHVSIIGTILDNHQFGFILNFPEREFDVGLKGKLRDHCEGINRLVTDRFSISSQFAFGGIYPALDSIHKSYLEAKKVVNSKALIKEMDTVFFEDIRNENRLDYPLSMQKQLIGRIKAGDLAKANGTLAALFDGYVYNLTYSREEVQEMLIMFMSAVLQSLYEDGYCVHDIGYSSKRVGECKNNTELEELLYGTVGELIGQQEQLQDRMSNNLYISKAIQYIERNYQEISSISDIAAHVGLSSSYLSRIFRSELGKPPLDYLTKLRIEKSKALLEKDEYKYSLQEICSAIGYNDVQSFIRFFKKYENRTPGEYRKALLQQK